MRKLILNSMLFLAAGTILIENTQAQQTPAASTQQAPAAKAAPSTGAQKTPAAKTGQAAKPRTQAVLTLKTQKDKVSYALGANLGMNLHKQSVDVDTAIVLRGLKDALGGGKLLLTDDEARATLTQLQTDLRNKQMEKMKEAADLNKKAGTEFLEANKAKEGVVTLPSGLQYKILTEGTGPKPTATDTVSCNYRGTLLDGTEFDSSYKHGQPASFPVTGVIKGWTEALQLMPVGSKWQLFVPSELAYGDRGADPRSGIGPSATLIFEVELLSIQEKVKTEVAPKSPDK
ncbi:MAG TPA: FKBP-type peptidyl-prolyl cis-trans isomerase [Candidatus Polarisedimenticolia bacterium]|nr:FKBP-type peptidyl-prolyl cis-trans isomerase [Candidatus Polarisedimenticolia bacterium]